MNKHLVKYFPFFASIFSFCFFPSSCVADIVSSTEKTDIKESSESSNNILESSAQNDNNQALNNQAIADDENNKNGEIKKISEYIEECTKQFEQVKESINALISIITNGKILIRGVNGKYFLMDKDHIEIPEITNKK